MGQPTHIYRVAFKEPVNGKTDYFYTSLSAIYTEFTVEEIGCEVERLWNIGVSDGTPYNGRKCSITKEPLKQKRRKSEE